MTVKHIGKKTILYYLKNFIERESSSGLVMIAATIIALFMANNAIFIDLYNIIINLPISVKFNNFTLDQSLAHWVNDFLMSFFFLVVVLELKYELLEGTLSQKGQFLLPFIAMIGGMFAPAVIYLIINFTYPLNLKGWAIPVATDIAFALCVLSFVSKSVPNSLRVFLMALAVFDDLAAIVIIALFYSNDLSFYPLILAIILTLFLLFLNYKNIRYLYVYMFLWLILWVCMLESGIHATISGVIVAICIPLKIKLRGDSVSPLKRLMNNLHPWVSFMILPIFAFVNSGISFKQITFIQLLEPIPLGIASGLFFGKQIGVMLCVWLTVKFGYSSLPKNSTWFNLYGVAIITGIGFTMSLFIEQLAFHDIYKAEKAKLGIMLGSCLSAIYGLIILKISSFNKPKLNKIKIEPRVKAK